MISVTRILFVRIVIACMLSCLHVPCPGWTENRSPYLRLPYVTPQMEDPYYWIKKISNPDAIFLDPEQIERMNRSNLGRRDLYLFDIREMPAKVTRQQMIALQQEDWDAFVKPGELRYGRSGHPLGESFYRELKANLNQESLKEENETSLGIVVRRTDIRVFPTEEQSRPSAGNERFDRFQHSKLSAGSAVGLYMLSRDGQWAYVQTQFIRGWIKITSLALAKERKKVLEYHGAKERLVITGSFVNVYHDRYCQNLAFKAQMGDTFPIVTSGDSVSISIPFRDPDGFLSFREGYVERAADVNHGFLPYTQRNVAQQAFKMLHEPYGWGEMFGARDCSRFILDIFATFGIAMPRNSKYQVMAGHKVMNLEAMDLKKKRLALDQAVPFVTLLRVPGHIMLYIGKDRDRHYVIHSLSGAYGSSSSEKRPEAVERVVVSDLSLGSSSQGGSLLQRLTDLSFFGAPAAKP